MPSLFSAETIYRYAPTEIETLIAKDLGVDPKRVKVRYIIQEVGGDPMDRFPGRNEVTTIEVTVDNKVVTPDPKPGPPGTRRT